MLSRGRLKFIKSLQLKKYRKQEQCFVVEGAKGIHELLKSDHSTVLLAGTPSFLATVMPLSGDVEVIKVTGPELERLSSLKSNNSGLAVVRMKVHADKPGPMLPGFTLALDGIRDPGNLGTIIRIADWYGIKNVVISEDSVDLYNPKVIQATMGSIFHLNVWMTDLAVFLDAAAQPVYGAYLEGEDIHSFRFETSGLIVIGNESTGISPSLGPRIMHRIAIPRYGEAESLNAAMATAVICDNLRRVL